MMIKTSVNFVLLLQDDFTGADLREDGFQFWVDGRRAAPLKKPEGLYVFAGLPGQSWTLVVTGVHYSPQTIKLDGACLDPRNPIAVLRLFRRSNLHFGDCEQICGSHLPGATVFALCKETPPLKLQLVEKPQEGPCRLTLMGYTPRPLLRRRFCVGTGKTRELFVITAKENDGGYLCDQHFRHRYKEGAPILRAYGAVCDEQGRFSIPIEPGMKANIQTVEVYNEEVRQWGCLLQTAPN